VEKLTAACEEAVSSKVVEVATVVLVLLPLAGVFVEVVEAVCERALLEYKDKDKDKDKDKKVRKRKKERKREKEKWIFVENNKRRRKKKMKQGDKTDFMKYNY
jgi:hypothetical protein